MNKNINYIHMYSAYFYEFQNLTKIINFHSHKPEENRYRALVSIEYFQNRESKYFHKGKAYDKKELHLIPKRCHIRDEPLTGKMLEAFKEDKIQIIQVNSVWEMYKEIGYDYKKQKYLQKDNCEIEGCLRKGIKGNENIINGKKVCDYCHATTI